MGRRERPSSPGRAKDPCGKTGYLEGQPWVEKGKPGRRRIFALVVALLAHGGLLLLTLPRQTVVKGEEARSANLIRLVQPPRPKPPDPREPRIPRSSKALIPVPDRTPDDLEPLTTWTLLEAEPMLDPDDLFFGAPGGGPPGPSEPSGPLEVGGDVRAPVLLEKVEPRYPAAAVFSQIEGFVILEAVIDKEGRVTDVKVLKELGSGCDEAAMKAARQWRYVPATLRGKPVAVYWRLTVQFKFIQQRRRR